MNTVRDNLIAARSLIDTPEKWPAKDIIDALDDVVGPDEFSYKAMRDELMAEMDRTRATSLGMFNNARSTTHADIMALFDRAIAAQGDA